MPPLRAGHQARMATDNVRGTLVVATGPPAKVGPRHGTTLSCPRRPVAWSKTAEKQEFPRTAVPKAMTRPWRHWSPVTAQLLSGNANMTGLRCLATDVVEATPASAASAKSNVAP